jgi:hypothetical protein
VIDGGHRPFEGQGRYIESTDSWGRVTFLQRGLSIGLFGSFYPYVNRLGPTSTSLALLIAHDARVDRVTVFAPRGSTIPPGPATSKIEVIPCWTPGKPLTLARAFVEMQSGYHNLDALLFNTYVSMFGRSPIPNGLGLVLPSVISKLSRKPTLVYMHNFLETQNVAALGYDLSEITKRVANLVERLLVSSTVVMVPLASQKQTVDQRFRTSIRQFFVPYLEGAWAYSQVQSSGALPHDDEWFTVLLFGSWGPQKDIRGVARVLKVLFNVVPRSRVILAGSINQNFPEYAAVTASVFQTLPRDRVKVHLNPTDSEVAQLALTSDVLVLPYSTTGGYSAVMNVAGLFGIRMIAYDLPQLRETADMLGENVQFVEVGNEAELLSTLLREEAVSATTHPSDRLALAKVKLERSDQQVRNLITSLIEISRRTV